MLREDGNVNWSSLQVEPIRFSAVVLMSLCIEMANKIWKVVMLPFGMNRATWIFVTKPKLDLKVFICWFIFRRAVF